MKLLGWLQRVLFLTAFGALGYCAYVWLDAWNFERQEVTRLKVATPEVAAELPTVTVAVRAARTGAVPIEGLLGRIEIPRLGVSAIILEGTSDLTLRRAVGHIEGTSLPGEWGNIGLSAHRDTFFRGLRNVRQDDAITIATPDGVFRYQVVSTQVVDPTDVWVLDKADGEVLTLVTCYPFSFIGAAPQRFIVRAERR